MKLGIFTMTQNHSFVKCLRSRQNDLEELKKLLDVFGNAGKYKSIIVTFVDRPPNFRQVIKDAAGDDVYAADVGYEFERRYFELDDVLVIQMVEECLIGIVRDDPHFGSVQEQLISVVRDWTTRVVNA